MSEEKKIIKLITKLICDTNDNRIFWSKNIVKSAFYNSPTGTADYYAEYNERYYVILRVELYPDNCFSLRLLLKDKIGTQLLDYTDSGLSDLYNVVLKQVDDSELNKAIDVILNSHVPILSAK